MTKLQLVTWAGLVLLVGLVIGSLVGNMYGSNKVQSAWDKERADTAIQVNNVNSGFRQKEAEHSKDSNEVADNAQISKNQYDADIAAINSSADDRVRQSEARASKYAAMSKASAAEQERLAKYAARLDQTVTEGRQLVEELTATIAERERTIHNLSNQITADRKLTNEY